MNKKTPLVGDPSHPFIKKLQEILPAREDVAQDALSRKTAQKEGFKVNAGNSRAVVIDSETIQKICAGHYIPTLANVSELALDCNLQRGKQGYAEFNDLGAAYIEHCQQKNKSSESSRPADNSEDTPPATLPEALRRIRRSRFYYPYDAYAANPIITAAERAALSSRQQKIAKPLTVMNIQNISFAHYGMYENGNAPILAIEPYIALFRCDEKEQGWLRTLHRPMPQHTPTPPEWQAAFRRFRLKNNWSTQHVNDITGNTSAVTHIEKGKSTQEFFLKIISALGFDSAEQFMAAEAALPETKASKLGSLKKVDKIDPEDAAAFRRWRLKTEKTFAQVADMAGKNASAILAIEQGSASQETFSETLNALGYTLATFLAEEAALPHNAKSLSVRAPQSLQSDR